MGNNYINLKLEEGEIDLILIALVQYIINNKDKKEIKEYINEAEILLENIKFYKRQKND